MVYEYTGVKRLVVLLSDQFMLYALYFHPFLADLYIKRSQNEPKARQREYGNSISVISPQADRPDTGKCRASAVPIPTVARETGQHRPAPRAAPRVLTQSCQQKLGSQPSIINALRGSLLKGQPEDRCTNDITLDVSCLSRKPVPMPAPSISFPSGGPVQ